MKALKDLKARYCAAVCGFALVAFAVEPVAAAPEPGIWQKHEYSFQFLGFTATYSCDGLAAKLRVLLLAAGARADARSTPGGCVRGYGAPDKFSRAQLTFYTLAPSSAAGDDKGASASAGVWRAVQIADRSPREIARGDCELVEQFRDQVLPMFSTRNVDSRITCVPNQLSGSAINLKFEVFAAAPAAKGK